MKSTVYDWRLRMNLHEMRAIVALDELWSDPRPTRAHWHLVAARLDAVRTAEVCLPSMTEILAHVGITVRGAR
jgi:hypothetical protein